LLARTGANAPLPDGGDNSRDHHQQRRMLATPATRRTSHESHTRQRLQRRSIRGGPKEENGRGANRSRPPGCGAALVAATVEQRHLVLAVPALCHRSSSLTKPGGQGGRCRLCSPNLIRQITAHSPARNLRKFCSPPARAAVAPQTLASKNRAAQPVRYRGGGRGAGACRFGAGPSEEPVDVTLPRR
jgi:hypothetical protein